MQRKGSLRSGSVELHWWRSWNEKGKILSKVFMLGVAALLGEALGKRIHLSTLELREKISVGPAEFDS